MARFLQPGERFPVGLDKIGKADAHGKGDIPGQPVLWYAMAESMSGSVIP
jgi:hypothetical protein